MNHKFDERKYSSRIDLLQIRYNPKSEIAERLRTIFTVSYEYILERKNNLPESPRKFIRVPKGQREYLAIYTTEYPDTYLLEYITQEDTRIIRETMAHEDEREYEASINYNVIDHTATITTVNGDSDIK